MAGRNRSGPVDTKAHCAFFAEIESVNYAIQAGRQTEAVFVQAQMFAKDALDSVPGLGQWRSELGWALLARETGQIIAWSQEKFKDLAVVQAQRRLAA